MESDVEAIKQYVCILDQRVIHNDEVSSKSYLVERIFGLILEKRLSLSKGMSASSLVG